MQKICRIGTSIPDYGALHVPAALDAVDLHGIRHALRDLPPAQAGVRVHRVAALRPLLAASGPVGAVAAAALGNACRPVRALLFDKTPATNWSLAWHQDRTISVAQRIDVDGFGPWTVKNGLLHVAPPFDILRRIVTLRVHLDPVPAANGPLLIAPGSHRFGRIAQADIASIVARCGTVACLADAGDIWLYATPILHASRPAREPGHRRVLQVDFSADELPGGLRWLGV
jgi:ectoine hydroxylase-related dioxygenase (phytanoyl-CoA dioxygenase family)